MTTKYFTEHQWTSPLSSSAIVEETVFILSECRFVGGLWHDSVLSWRSGKSGLESASPHHPGEEGGWRLRKVMLTVPTTL